MWGITDFKKTLKFHFHTQKLQPLFTALKKSVSHKSTAQSLSLEWPHFTF